MRSLILAACLSLMAAPALAQAAPPPPEWMGAAMRALSEQRNEALDRAASLGADLEMARREIATLKQAAAKAAEKPADTPTEKHE